jgi:hypothetical protein
MPLSRPILAVLRLLQDRGCGTEGETLFGGTDSDLPNVPTAILSVQQTGGPLVRVHNTSSLRFPGFQVTARGDVYNEVDELIHRAFDAIDGGETQKIVNLLVLDTFFLWMRPASVIYTLPNDVNQHVRLVFNVESECR